MIPRALENRWTLVLALSIASMAPCLGQEPPSPEPTEQDRATLEQLQALTIHADAFGEVEVEVIRGVVKLRGATKTPSQKEEFAKIARELPGVLYVENRIELPPPPDEPPVEDESESVPGVPTVEDQQIAEKLRASFSRIPALKKVQVEVMAGIVHLTGEVPSSDGQEKATTLAEKFGGVLLVSNETTETVDVVERLTPSADRLFEYVRDILATLPLFAVAVLILLAFWFLGRWVESWNTLFEKLTDNRLIRGVLKQTTRVVLLLLGIFLGLEVMDATALVGAVLGTAGVVGLAVGFAFRDIVENYLASIILSVRQPFRSKDYVEIDGQGGTVIRMGLRDTVLMSSDGNHVTFPNAQVFKSTLINYTRNPMRRFALSVGVGTEVDLKEAARLGIGVLEAMAGVVDDPAPSARVESLGDSNVTLTFYGWVDQGKADYGKAKSEAFRLIKAVFDEHEIAMPAPIYQVDLRRLRAEAEMEVEKPRAGSAENEARQADVEVDRHIEEQVERDIQTSEEDNLLVYEPETEMATSGSGAV